MGGHRGNGQTQVVVLQVLSQQRSDCCSDLLGKGLLWNGKVNTYLRGGALKTESIREGDLCTQRSNLVSHSEIDHCAWY